MCGAHARSLYGGPWRCTYGLLKSCDDIIDFVWSFSKVVGFKDFFPCELYNRPCNHNPFPGNCNRNPFPKKTNFGGVGILHLLYRTKGSVFLNGVSMYCATLQKEFSIFIWQNSVLSSFRSIKQANTGPYDGWKIYTYSISYYKLFDLFLVKVFLRFNQIYEKR